MPSCLVHTGDESVTLSAATVKRLLDRGDGDAALLYLALLRLSDLQKKVFEHDCGGVVFEHSRFFHRFRKDIPRRESARTDQPSTGNSIPKRRHTFSTTI